MGLLPLLRLLLLRDSSAHRAGLRTGRLSRAAAVRALTSHHAYEDCDRILERRTRNDSQTVFVDKTKLNVGRLRKGATLLIRLDSSHHGPALICSPETGCTSAASPRKIITRSVRVNNLDSSPCIGGARDSCQDYMHIGGAYVVSKLVLKDVTIIGSTSLASHQCGFASLVPERIVRGFSGHQFPPVDGSSGNVKGVAEMSTTSSAALNKPSVRDRSSGRESTGAYSGYKPLEQRAGRGRGGKPPEFGRGQVLVDHVCRILSRADKWSMLSQIDFRLDAFHVGEVLKRLKDAKVARGFFNWAKSQADFQHNRFTYNIMIRILTLAKDFNATQFMVDEMYTSGCGPDVVTYTTLIKGFSSANRYQEALDAFQHMKQAGCKPNIVTYLVVMNIYARTGAVNDAWKLFHIMQEEGVQPNSTSYSLMINCLGKAGDLSSATALFAEMKAKGCKPDVVTYTSMIDLHSKAGLSEQAFDLYREMLRAGVKPDLVTLCAVMDCLGKAGDVVGASRLFDYLKVRGYRPDAVAYTTIIDIHSKAGFYQKALQLFEEMKEVGVQPNTVNYNSVIDCYGRSGNLPAALELFREMKALRCAPDLQTYGILMCQHSKLGLLEGCLQLFEQVRSAGLQPNSVILISMVDCFGKAGKFSAALDLFRQMQAKGGPVDVVCYTRMIDICWKCGYYDKAMDFYHEMQRAGVEPNIFTYNSLIHCMGKFGNPDGALELLGEMRRRGCEPNVVTYNTLIDLYSKTGSTDRSLETFKDMHSAGIQPDSGTFISLMEVLSKAGRCEEAEGMFEKMKERGYDVRLPAYNILIDMWGKAGNIEKVQFWHNVLIDSGLTPDLVTYRILVSTHLRLHRYGEVLANIKCMASLGLPIDCSMSAILLQHCSGSEQQEHIDALLAVLANIEHPASAFVNKLVEYQNEDVKAECQRFLDSLQDEEMESKIMFIDALIMFLHSMGRTWKAGQVWDYAMENSFFPQAVTMQQAPSLWFMDFHSMSVGTALVALTRTLANFRKTMLTTKNVPDQVLIITGWGKGSKVPGCSTVKQAIQGKLTALKSPFYVNGMNLGCFVCRGEPFLQWVRQVSLD